MIFLYNNGRGIIMGHYFINDKNLKSDIKMNTEVINGTEFTFFTDNGLFSKRGLDYGTRVLLENFEFGNKKSFLDVGCGCGPIGIFIAKYSKDYTVDMIDINEKAIELSKKGIEYNKLSNVHAFQSNTYENVKNKYDAILINPPIHAGKKVVYNIIEDAIHHLNTNGEVWVVIRKDQGAKSLMKDMEHLYNFEIVKRDNGFYIIKSKI